MIIFFMIFPRYSNIGIFPGHFYDQHNWCLMFNVGATEAMWLMVSPCFTQYYNIDDHGMVGNIEKHGDQTWSNHQVVIILAVKYWHGNGHFVHWINLIVPMIFRWSAQIVPLKMARLTSGSSHPPFFSKQIRFPPVVSSLSTTYHLVMTNTCFTKVSKSWTRETCRPTGNCCRCNHEIDPLWIHPSRFWLSIELSDDIWWSDMKDGEGSKLHFPPMASYGILWESYGNPMAIVSFWELKTSTFFPKVIQRLRATTCFIWVCLGLEGGYPLVI